MPDGNKHSPMKMLLVLINALALSPAPASSAPALIPLPASMRELDKPAFVIDADTAFVATGEAAREAAKIAGRLRICTGHELPVNAEGAGISMALDPALDARLGDEGYTLEASNSGVRIQAAGPAGLFYGGQTLLQLLPAEALSAGPAEGVEWTVPAVSIEDRPRFGWRGFMLDESRHFFGTEHVRRLLDGMAQHKLNLLHWHLTDDEGWRIEIRSYPKLTTVGAWRGSECEIPNAREEKYTRYGGFYTQDQIREIVAYAKARHIEIMPEVDMPGHSLAVLAAYPGMLPEGAGGGVSEQGFKRNALSPAKEETYRFVQSVFDELHEMFPFEYVHIGGDEVNEKTWKDCPQIKGLMEREKLADLKQVQVYFTRRLEKIFAERGKRIFGWNEILNDHLDRRTGIMAWTGSGPGYTAANKGFPVVMVPAQNLYLDMIHPGASDEPPAQDWAGSIDEHRIYSFDPPGAKDLTREAKDRILGVQAALWTEFVYPWKDEAIELATHSAHADYKTWPRLVALAEVAWTPQERREYEDFAKRNGLKEMRRLGFLGLEYRIPLPTATRDDGRVTIHPPFSGAEIRYTLDGSVPTNSSPEIDGPIETEDLTKLRARVFIDGRGGRMLTGPDILNPPPVRKPK